MAERSGKKLIPMALAAGTAIAVLVGVGLWWTAKLRYETTDNAFVQADTVLISPQVSGYVNEVLVTDNQRVEPGQVLARIDPAPLQAKLDQAIADARSLGAAVQAVDDKAALEKAMIAQKSAGLESAKATAHMADADMARYGALAQQGWVSPQKVQSQKASAEQAAAGVGQAAAALEAERQAALSLGSARSQSLAQAAAAKAAVQQARLDLEHAVIRAPTAGVVGARSVRVGQLVQSGATLMAVVPLGQAYVVANFKETQMNRLRVGQHVQIHADAFGKTTMWGRLESFAPATGAEFALIPVENAVGNFTKIAQRVPVKITLDPGQGGALRPGLSVEVKVDVSDSSGRSFADAAQADVQLARRGADR